MLKKENLTFGFTVALLITFVFAFVFYKKPADVCELNLPNEILLSPGEFRIIEDFDREIWRVEIQNPAIFRLTSVGLHALAKGETNVRFTKKEDENCSFTKHVAISNLTSTAASRKLSGELNIDLPDAAESGNIPLFPPTN